jgi:metal-responsive CopG/Arc/MetJ family transcriptional regulator
MISMPKEFLDEIDKAAREERRSRSEFIREAARLYLRIRKNRVPPGQDPQIQKAIAAQDALARQDAATEWNSTTEIRKWRENR